MSPVSVAASAREAAPALLAALFAATSAVWTRLALRSRDAVASAETTGAESASLLAHVSRWDEWLLQQDKLVNNHEETHEALLSVAAACSSPRRDDGDAAKQADAVDDALRRIGAHRDSELAVAACALAAHLLLALRSSSPCPCSDSSDAAASASALARSTHEHVQAAWALLEGSLHARRNACKAALRRVRDAVLSLDQSAAQAGSATVDVAASGSDVAEAKRGDAVAAATGGSGRGRGSLSTRGRARKPVDRLTAALGPAPTALMLRPRPEVQAVREQFQRAAGDAAAAAAIATSSYAAAVKHVQEAIAAMLAAALESSRDDHAAAAATVHGGGAADSTVTQQHTAGVCLLHLAELRGFAREAAAAARQLIAAVPMQLFRSVTAPDTSTLLIKLTDSDADGSPSAAVHLAAWAALSPASPRPLVLLGTLQLTREGDVFAACCCYMQALQRLDSMETPPQRGIQSGSDAHKAGSAAAVQMPTFACTMRRIVLANLAAVARRAEEQCREYGRAPGPRMGNDSHLQRARADFLVESPHALSQLWSRFEAITAQSASACFLSRTEPLQEPFFRYLALAVASVCKSVSASASAADANGTEPTGDETQATAAAAALSELPLMIRRRRRLAAHAAEAAADGSADGLPSATAAVKAAEELQSKMTAALTLLLQLPNGAVVTAALAELRDAFCGYSLIEAAAEVCAATAATLESPTTAALDDRVTGSIDPVSANSAMRMRLPATLAILGALTSSARWWLALRTEPSLAAALARLATYAAGARSQLCGASAHGAACLTQTLDALLAALEQRRMPSAEPSAAGSSSAAASLSTEAPPFMPAADWRAAAVTLGAESSVVLAGKHSDAHAAAVTSTTTPARASPVKLLRPRDLAAAATAVPSDAGNSSLAKSAVRAPLTRLQDASGASSVAPQARTVAECSTLLDQLEKEVASHLAQLTRIIPSPGLSPAVADTTSAYGASATASMAPGARLAAPPGLTDPRLASSHAAAAAARGPPPGLGGLSVSVDHDAASAVAPLPTTGSSHAAGGAGAAAGPAAASDASTLFGGHIAAHLLSNATGDVTGSARRGFHSSELGLEDAADAVADSDDGGGDAFDGDIIEGIFQAAIGGGDDDGYDDDAVSDDGKGHAQREDAYGIDAEADSARGSAGSTFRLAEGGFALPAVDADDKFESAVAAGWDGDAEPELPEHDFDHGLGTTSAVAGAVGGAGAPSSSSSSSASVSASASASVSMLERLMQTRAQLAQLTALWGSA